MNFVLERYGINLLCPENEITVIVLENKTVFSSVIQDLWQQYEGNEGEVIISDEKPISISKRSNVIINPFSIDCNEKKLIGQLYKEMVGIISEKYSEEIANINTATVSLLDLISNHLPYCIDFEVSMDILSLLKEYNVKFDYHGDTLLEELIDYLRLTHQICNKNIAIFLNIKQFLTDQELLQLYEFAVYENIAMILIEGKDDHILNGEKHWIIDADLCMIEL